MENIENINDDYLSELPDVSLDDDGDVTGFVDNENVTFESMDDVIGLMDDEVIEENSIGSTIMTDFEDWLKEDLNSPVKFSKNLISEVVKETSTIKMLYDNLELFFENEGTPVYICAASMKSAGYIISDIAPKDNCKQSDTLVIYGHDKDTEDKYHSRLDEDLVDLICTDFKSKFKEVDVFGYFNSIESMKYVLDALYDRLVDKLDGVLYVYLDSKVKDDDGNIRTVVNVLSSGYIPSLSDKPGKRIKYIFKRFSKKMIARLYTDTLPDEVFEDGKFIYKIKDTE